MVQSSASGIAGAALTQPRYSRFKLASPADALIAIYLFHYAESEDELFQMRRFIDRNLTTGGRFVTYTINPAYNFGIAPSDMEAQIGFHCRVIAALQFALAIEDFEVPIW